MTELKELLHQKISETLDEKLDGIITAKIEKCIDEIFRDLLNDWSDFGKDLKKHISKALKIELDHNKIETYNNRVISIITEILNKKVEEDVIKSISSAVNESVSLLEKREWKLSEIIERFVKYERLDKEGSCEITCEVQESNYGYIYIYIDEKERESAWNCKHQFSIEKKNGEIWFYSNRDRKNTTVAGNMGHINSFDHFCFALYTQRAIIKIDDYETEFYRD